MIRALIVDDSPTARLALRAALAECQGVEVIAEAQDRNQAVSAVEGLRPDIVLMDVYLGDDNGLDVTAEIMSTRATPILVVTGVDPDNPDLVFRAIEAGALDVLAKLPARTHDDYPHQLRQLARLVDSLSKVPVVTRRSSSRRARNRRASRTRRRRTPRERALVVIGASTGGPPILHQILGALSSPVSAPIVVAQHMAHGFARSLADWLERDTGHRVVVCDRPMQLAGGTVYIATDGRHVVLRPAGLVAPASPSQGDLHTPSINALFASAAEHASGVVAILLSGMGRDGAAGMQSLRGAGNVCVAQAPATCTVDSMPKSAIRSGAAELVLAPEQIVELLE